ncbi:class I SAM-dependent methyltransferase [Imperialibacter roseus]|uniref:Class I SAM-dependent methyltransferase n=1 Tax=Imperialibacter roseus TaxID=1324217 RepID=A0ABZ0IKY6_9BACT|nr:class I SAM-dependent methyltransferase [Imperialibacter roseus]WOK05326.1 class I SAM-dependent methyltransferase [Imperialibacter roseus]
MKDRFSDKASGYAAFRPKYPETLFNHLYTHTKTFDAAWDAGTGNGQVAAVLAGKFNRVYATDISIKQLMKVPNMANLSSFVADEAAPQISDTSIDLITVAQAIHWFQIDKFCDEVTRVAKPGALLATWGYGLMQLPPAYQPAVDYFYSKVVGPYWDAERKHIDNSYADISIPFKELKPSEHFEMIYKWNTENLEGYLNTWSSVGNYIKEKKENPVTPFIKELKTNGLPESFPVSFPLFVRLFRL